MRYLFVLLLAVLSIAVLPGCAHRREVAAIKHNSGACEQLGYQSGTVEFVNCTALVEKYRAANRGGKEFKMPMAKDPSREMTCVQGAAGATSCQ